MSINHPEIQITKRIISLFALILFFFLGAGFLHFGKVSAQSCAGFCFPNGSPDSFCYCDDLCFVFGDCCSDVCEECPDLTSCGGGGGDPTGSCEGFCFPCGTPNEGGCYCDELCFIFGDCCNNVCQECTGLSQCLGACCLPDGSCLYLDGASCTMLGGSHQGGDSFCDVYFEDMDGDGYGNPEMFIQSCDPLPEGYVRNPNDCDDADPNSGAVGAPCDDGNDHTIDDVIDENCECVGGQNIPTLSQWGMIILALCFVILGIVGIRMYWFRSRPENNI